MPLTPSQKRKARRKRAKIEDPPAPVRPKPPVVVLTPGIAPRYFLACVACGYDLHATRPEPRLPLCQRCHRKRAAKKAARRAAKQAVRRVQ